MTDTSHQPEILEFDLDRLNVGEITFLELELNRQIKDLIAPDIVTFTDVVAQFRYARGAKDPETGEPLPPPRLFLPTGPILQTVGLIQLRRSNPDATWEQAGEMRLQLEGVETSGADPTKMVAEAQAAASMPEDPMEILERAATATFEPPPTTLSSEPTSTGS